MKKNFVPQTLAAIAALLCGLLAGPVSYGQIITTFAGNGAADCTGDGGRATAAAIQSATEIAIDRSGNVYIADDFNNRIRKITPSGIISTFAGTGVAGYSGDGGPATAAQFWEPQGITFDRSGNLFVADYVNNCIRKITPAGIISTVAGMGTNGFSGDGGPATAAELFYTPGVAVDDSGNLYIADEANNRIRKVNTAGIISTIAGGGTTGALGDGGQATDASFFRPGDVVLDARGNLYVADAQDNRVRIINSAGIINTYAGNGNVGYSGDGGPATAAELNRVVHIGIDGAGNLYLADEFNNAIRKVDTFGIITTIAGNGTPGFRGDGRAATLAELDSPGGVRVDEVGNIYIGDMMNNRIRKIWSPTAGTNALVHSVPAQIIVFPDPNFGIFTINLISPAESDVPVTITNIVGQKMAELLITPNKETELKLEVPGGMYFLSAIVNGERVSGKIIVE